MILDIGSLQETTKIQNVFESNAQDQGKYHMEELFLRYIPKIKDKNYKIDPTFI